MTVITGIAAALAAPLFEAVGFLEFERHWRVGRGSAFSLNLFKCNVATLGFIFMVWLDRMGLGAQPGTNPFNAVYIEHEPPNVYQNIGNQRTASDPMGHAVAQQEEYGERERGPFLRRLQEVFMQPAGAQHESQQILVPDKQQQQQQPPQQQQPQQLPQPPEQPQLQQIQPQLQEQQQLQAQEQPQTQELQQQNDQQQRHQVFQQHQQAQDQQKQQPHQDQQQQSSPLQRQSPQQQLQVQDEQQLQPLRDQRQQQPLEPQQQLQQAQNHPFSSSQLVPDQQGLQQNPAYVLQQTAFRPPNDEQAEYMDPQRLQSPQSVVQQQFQTAPSSEQLYSTVNYDFVQNTPQMQYLPQEQQQAPHDQYRERIQSPWTNHDSQQEHSYYQVQSQRAPSSHAFSQAQEYDRLSFVQPFRPAKRDGEAFTVITVSHLILSSLLGIFIGDCCELEALRLIGARRVLLMASMKPFAAAFLANWILREDLHAAALLGMALTMIGVLLVVHQSMEKLSGSKKKSDGKMNNIRQSVRQNFLSLGARTITKKSTNGASILDASSSETSANDTSSVTNGMVFGTVWESNGFSYVSIPPAHKSLSKFDVLYDVSSDEESDSAHDERMLDDDEQAEFDDDGDIRPLLELGHIVHIQSHGRSISAASMESWGSFEKFVETQNESYPNSPCGGLDNTSVVSEDSENYFNEVDVPLPLLMLENKPDNATGGHDAEHFSPTLTVHSTPIPEAPAKDCYPSMFLSAAEIAEEDLLEFRFSNTKIRPRSEEATAETFTSSSRSRMRSSRSVGSFGSFRSECGPPPGSRRENSRTRLIRIRQGYFLALCNVCLDAYGSILTKQYGVNMSTWEINVIRYGFAGCILLMVSTFLRIRDIFCGGESKYGYGMVRGSFKKKKKPNTVLHGYAPIPGQSRITEFESSWYRMPNMSSNSWLVILLGVLFVSFLCPALQSYALFQLAFSLAITLNSVTPLYAIPLLWVLKGQKPSERGCWGATIAVSGVAVFCCWGLVPE